MGRHNIVKVGDRFKTKHCGYVTVTQYNNADTVHVMFDDGYTLISSSGSLRKGTVKNPFYPTIYGIGYTGIGEYSATNYLNIYKIWHSLLRRCYDIDFQKNHSTYMGCTVAKRWHNFQNFCEDYINMIGYGIYDWQIDKDIIFKGNKLYSRKRCFLIPRHINSLLTKRDACRGDCCIGVTLDKYNANYPYKAHCCVNGKVTTVGLFKTENEAFAAYKSFKEKEIKRVAKLYKNQIAPQAYKSLLKYEVHKND